MMIDPEAQYCMRGHRVPALSSEFITDVAYRVCEIFNIRKRSFKPGQAEKLILRCEHYGIHVDPVLDADWIDATRAMADPQKGMIYMPESLYDALCRGKGEAVRIFLHEIGHIVLGHRPLLHFSDAAGKPKEAEDSEWQADYFADAVISILGINTFDMQLEFKF